MTFRNLVCLFVFFSMSFSVSAQSLDGKVFILENQANGKALAVNGVNIGKKGSAVHSWPLAKDNKHQHWKFVASGDGSDAYYIISASPQTKEAKYLEVGASDVGKNGGKIQMWNFNGGSSSRYGANQVWTANRSSDGLYNFTSAHATRKGVFALELAGGEINKNGGKMQIWKNLGYKNQKWTLIPVK